VKIHNSQNNKKAKNVYVINHDNNFTATSTATKSVFLNSE